jgi:hypothetical protein
LVEEKDLRIPNMRGIMTASLNDIGASSRKYQHQSSEI